MISLPTAFYALLKQDAMPEILAILSNTSGTRYVYGKTRPSVGQPVSTVWDGTRLYGQGTYGNDTGLIEAGARVLNFGSIDTSIAYSRKDLMLSLEQAQIGSTQLVLDNGDGYFSDLLGGDKAVSFLNFNLQITCGFPSIDFSDAIELFNGTITEETLINKALKIVAESQTPTLIDAFTLPRSGRYTSPKSQNDVISYGYGNTAENSTLGVSVCPCIDTVNNVFAFFCHALPATASVGIYVDGVLQTTGYTVTLSGDYESKGVISYVTFTTPQTGTVTMTTTKGKDNLTNPVDILEDILNEAGDTTVRNVNSWARAKNDANLLSYVAAGVLAADQPPSYWMSNILSSFLGSWYLNTYNELVISFDSSRLLLDVAGVLHEYDAMKITGQRTRQNLVNQVFVNYAYSLADTDRRFSQGADPQYLAYDDGETTKDDASQTKYGVLQKTVDLQWVHNTATVTALQSRIVGRYASPVWTLTYPEQTFRNLAVEPGDFVAYSWESQEDDEGLPVKNQIARVLKVNRDLDALTITFDLIDFNSWMTVDPYVWDGSHTYGEPGATYGMTRDRRNI